MKKYGIFYGSATGTTEKVAKMIAEKLGVKKDDLHDVRTVSPESLADYEVLILGTSTWGDGEVEDDWYDLLAAVSVVSLPEKKVALFGCGDETMTETFCNGVGELYKRMQPTGCRFIGAFNADGFNFNHSSAIVDGKAVGLLLDQVNHADLTESKIDSWLEVIKNS